MKNKILILSDSVALGRFTPEKVTHEETWPVLLGEAHRIHQVSIGGGTIDDLMRQVPYHKAYDPAVVILQSGIVDCAPRFLSQFELALLKRTPLVGKWMIGQMNRAAVRNFRKLSYTPPARFRQQCKAIRKEFQSVPVYALGILPAVPQYEAILPGVSKNIRAYNAILAEVFGDRFIDMVDFPAAGLMTDHHHVNQTGHRFIYERISSRIEHGAGNA